MSRHTARLLSVSVMLMRIWVGALSRADAALATNLIRKMYISPGRIVRDHKDAELWLSPRYDAAEPALMSNGSHRSP